jgi:hypothetical protein
MRYGNGHPIQEERLSKALSEFAARTVDVRLYWFFQAATYLPADRLKPILIQLQSNPVYGGFRNRLEQAIDLIDRRESNRDKLMSILEPR